MPSLRFAILLTTPPATVFACTDRRVQGRLRSHRRGQRVRHGHVHDRHPPLSSLSPEPFPSAAAASRGGGADLTKIQPTGIRTKSGGARSIEGGKGPAGSGLSLGVAGVE